MRRQHPGALQWSLRPRPPRSWPTRSSARSSSGCGSPTPRWPVRRRCCGASCSPTGRVAARAAGWPGSTAMSSSAASATSRSSGIPSSCGSGCRATGVSTTAVTARSSATTAAGWPVRARSTTRRCATFVMRRLAIDKATVSAVARELGRSWDTVNTIAVEATQQLLLSAGPARLDGVRVIGVDEHQWSHVLGADADGFVTVITDLTPVVAGHGPGAAAGHGARALRGRHGRLAGRPRAELPGPGRDRGDGRVRRLQDRRHRGAARTR